MMVFVFAFISIAQADHKFYSKADVSTCFGNLGCKASEILPFNQTADGPDGYKDWAPVSRYRGSL